MAVNIIINAKTQRLGTCNTCESLVLHKNILESHGPAIIDALLEKGVQVRGDERVYESPGHPCNRRRLEQNT